MALRLLIVRHGRAADGAPDLDRPLDAVGRQEAAAMGAWVAAQGFAPAEALASSARRTRETLEAMSAAWEPPPIARHHDELYAAGPEAILAVLAGAEADTVALVGHNPGVGLLAARLARAAPDHPRWGDFPTASVAVLSFEAEAWDGVADGAGTLLAFAVPSDLA